VININPNKKKKYTKSNIDRLFEKLGHNTDVKDIFETDSQKQVIKTSNEIEKDFHQMKLVQVKNWLLIEMLGYCEAGYTCFVLIHGYKHGDVIRSYLRRKFQKEFEDKFQKMKLEVIPRERGVTEIRIRN
jgi:hypothetical protein